MKNTQRKGSNGGIVMAVRQRAEAMERYLQNPKICKHCNNTIIPIEGEKISQVRMKDFCNRSCSTSYNNAAYPKRKRTLKPSDGIKRTRKRKDKTDEKWIVLTMTKGEVFARYRGYQSARSVIQKHCKFVYVLSGKPRVCYVCGYSNHINVAHKQAVSRFDDSTPIAIINGPENLVALCPNHHWEFDHDFFSLI